MDEEPIPLTRRFVFLIQTRSALFGAREARLTPAVSRPDRVPSKTAAAPRLPWERAVPPVADQLSRKWPHTFQPLISLSFCSEIVIGKRGRGFTTRQGTSDRSRRASRHNRTTDQSFVVNLLSDELVLAEGVAGFSRDGVYGPLLHLLLDGTVKHEQRLPGTFLVRKQRDGTIISRMLLYSTIKRDKGVKYIWWSNGLDHLSH